jgi:PKD repeat protein
MKKFTRRKSVWLLVVLIYSCNLFSQTKTIPYQQLTSGSGIYFGATMNTNSITVNFEGPADRWFAFGLGSFMASDAFIYSNGISTATHTVGWYDYINSSSGTTKDGTQDWNIVSTGTVSGQRTVTATRALNTGDVNDAVITFSATTLSLIWAKGFSANDYTISYHGSSNRACCISLTWLSAPSASFATSTTTVCAGSSLTYSNLTTGGQTSYTWSFAGGNPSTSNSTNPNVQYTTPGSYSVALTATNTIGSATYTQVNYITVTPTVAPTLSIALTGGSNPLCAGSFITFTASSTNGGGSPSYQWKVNGVNAGTNSSTFTTTTLNNGAVVTCVMTSNATCATPSAIASSGITMTVNSTAPASVSIALTSNNNPICIGAAAVFAATPGNGGITPSYQWKINSVNAGNNSPTFTTNTLSNGDVVTCVLSSNAPCASSTLATSAGITMTVSSLLTPTIGVSLISGTNPFCAGSAITLSASSVNGGSAPTFQWKVNGANTGSNSAVFSSTTLANGNSIICVMASNLSCSSPNTATSSAITLTVYPIPPTPTVIALSSPTFCTGENVVLASSSASDNIWSNSANTQTILVFSSGNYSVMQVSNGCASAHSNTLSVLVHPNPNVSVSPAGPFCNYNFPVALLANPNGGVFSGTGVSGMIFDPSIAIIGNNVVNYNYVDPNTGCNGTSSIVIIVSNCLGLNNFSNSTTLVSCYPNPVQKSITLDSQTEKIKQVSIYDFMGRCVQKEPGLSVNKLKLDLSHLASGNYIFEIKLEHSTVRSKINKQD